MNDPKCTCDETGPDKCPLFEMAGTIDQPAEIGKGRVFETMAEWIKHCGETK